MPMTLLCSQFAISRVPERLCSFPASQRLGILRKSWRIFHDRLLLVKCLQGFVLPVLEYYSAVWCSAADTHLKLLDSVVSGDSFLTGGVFECHIFFVQRRSVAVLCMLYKMRCNPMYGVPSLWCSTWAV